MQTTATLAEAEKLLTLDCASGAMRDASRDHIIISRSAKPEPASRQLLMHVIVVWAVVAIATFTSPTLLSRAMALSSAGVCMCEPTQLYNLLIQVIMHEPNHDCVRLHHCTPPVFQATSGSSGGELPVVAWLVLGEGRG